MFYYESYSSPFQGLQIGEEYTVAYEESNPKTFSVIWSRPVFDKANFLVTPVLECKENWLDGGIEIYYKFNNKIYNRGLVIPERVSKSEIDCVYVCKSNPRISYCKYN
jgi:hypothetical protein